MVISKENKDFIDSLIDYYISESESYKQIAENFVPEIKISSRYSIWDHHRMCIFWIFTSISESATNTKFRGYEGVQSNNKRQSCNNQEIHH